MITLTDNRALEGETTRKNPKKNGETRYLKGF